MPDDSDTTHSQPETVVADKQLRHRAILAAVLISLPGLAVIGLLDRRLDRIEELAAEDLPAAKDQVIRLTAVLAWTGGVGFVGTAAWLWRLGRRINLSGRFPPPGMKVVKNTTVRTGHKARTLANLAQLAALLCAVAGTVGMWYLYRLAVDAAG